MSSTSQKHRNFVSEPMGEKPVTDLAGIGDVLGQRLVDAGYDKVDLCIIWKLLKTSLSWDDEYEIMAMSICIQNIVIFGTTLFMS